MLNTVVTVDELDDLDEIAVLETVVLGYVPAENGVVLTYVILIQDVPWVEKKFASWNCTTSVSDSCSENEARADVLEPGPEL